MPIELTVRNVVYATQSFNLNLLTDRWLLRTEVFRDEDFDDERATIRTPVYSRIEAHDFRIDATGDRVQLHIKRDVAPADAEEIIRVRFGRLLTATRHFPPKAIGLNFQYAGDVDGRFAEISRRFFPDQNPFVAAIGTDDPAALWGAMAIKSCCGGKMKVEAVPAVRFNPEQTGIMFDFNFHYEMNDEQDRTDTAIEAVGHWGEAAAEAARISNQLGEMFA